MAAITTTQLLYEVRSACHRSSLVLHIEERILDIDIMTFAEFLQEVEKYCIGQRDGEI